MVFRRWSGPPIFKVVGYDMPAKVLVMARAQSTQGVELSAFDREIARQQARSARLETRIRDVPDDWPTFPSGCRWVGHESDKN
jgi:hypothetical protein